MALRDVPLSQIDSQVIMDLVESGARESRTLDFKRELPGAGRDAKQGFLADVTAFANTEGGDLVFGIEEVDGVATKVVGTGGAQVDESIIRLQNLIRDGTEPRLQGVEIHAVDCAGRGTVIVARVPRSWAGPHAVLGRTLPIYARSTAGNYPMDMRELRDAVDLRSRSVDWIREFRRGRIRTIRSNATPAPVGSGPKLILHIVPLSAPSGFSAIEIGDCVGRASEVTPLYALHGSEAFNADGFLIHTAKHNDTDASYTQIFRNGAVEAVDTLMLDDPSLTIPAELFEGEIIQGALRYVRFISDLGVPPPYMLTISLLGVKGYSLNTDHRTIRVARDTSIDRNDVTAPDVLIETVPEDERVVARTLRPAFDTIWNAAGYPRALSYDEVGDWAGRLRTI